MELRDAIRKRRMVRAFSPEPLPDGALDELLDLARRGPSAGNTMASAFVVLDTPDLTRRYWDITLPDDGDGSPRARFRWQQLLDAPALVLVTTEPGQYLARYSEPDKSQSGRGESPDRWPVPYWWVDVGAVIQNLLLMVTAAGFGACLFGPFDHEERIANEFDIGQGVRIAATIAIGRPLPDEPGRSSARTRQPANELITRPPAKDVDG